MTTQELRELDAYCAEYVMGWKRLESIMQITKEGEFALGSTFQEPPEVMIDNGYSRVKNWVPTNKSGDAMDVLKKCAEKYDCHSIRFADKWYVGARNTVAANESLETVICLLAKQLFSQTTK